MSQQFQETVTFTQHYVDQVNTKYGARTKNTFVTADNRRFETWKADVAAQVAASMNQPITVAGEVKTSGQYTNIEIQSVVVTTNGAPVPQPIAAVEAGVVGAAPAPAPAPSSDDRQVSIQRQSALKAAIEAFQVAGIDPVTHSNELVEWADTVAFNYFANGFTAVLAEEVTA